MNDWLIRYRHTIFICGLLVFFFVPELAEILFGWRAAFPWRILIFTASSIPLVLAHPKEKILLGILIVMVFIMTVFWGKYQLTPGLTYTAISLLLVYFTIITLLLFNDVFRAREVSIPIVIGSFSGYFLIGVLFFLFFALLDIALPDTLNIDNSLTEGLESTFYFSFITLATVGYGDYLPTSTLGQKVAILEALAGQFYIAAVIATIVGKFISRPAKGPSD